MITIARILILIGALNFFVPLFAFYLISGRELVQERGWEMNIQRTHSEAFDIGPDNPEVRKENEEYMARIFSEIVKSRRDAGAILDIVLSISWGMAATVFICAYRIFRYEKENRA